MADLITALYPSIVAASLVDEHGGDPLNRTQIFINHFARQCKIVPCQAWGITVPMNNPIKPT